MIQSDIVQILGSVASSLNLIASAHQTTWMDGVGLVISVATFGVVLAYTFVTYRLLKTAERQFEASEKPILLFNLSTTDCQLGDPMDLVQPTIRNIGSGTAFNVLFEPMKGNGIKVNFLMPNMPSYIEAKQQLPLTVSIKNDDGIHSSESLWLLANIFEQNRFPDDLTVVVQFENISGKKYRSRNRVLHYHKCVATELVLPIEEVS